MSYKGERNMADYMGNSPENNGGNYSYYNQNGNNAGNYNYGPQNGNYNYSMPNGNPSQSYQYDGGSGSFGNYEMSGFEKNTAYAGERISLSKYTAFTYLWMAAGLLLTFAVAYGVYISGVMSSILTGGLALPVIIGASILEIVLVFILAGRITKMSVGAARVMFFVYAAVNGFTLSIYFLRFDVTILVYAFAATAVLFALMAGASLIFNLQLDRIFPILMFGLFALIIFGILGMFLNLGVLNIAICYLGIAVFMGLTAYDTAKIRVLYETYSGRDAAMLQKASIYAALQLYLDFINLLLYILRLFGGRSND